MSDLIPSARTIPSVLFLCVHNAGRSQMAAGFLRHLGEKQVEVLSAGSAPGDVVNPAAVEAMAERGIDLTREVPRRWVDSDLDRVDVVVTMGCGDECPYVPDTVYEDWPLEDPAGQGVDAVRLIRDEIELKVRDLMRRLSVDASKL